MTPGFSSRDDLAGGYVECSECGHPIEQHNTKGCDICGCSISWTRKEIRAERVRNGLTGTRDWRDYS